MSQNPKTPYADAAKIARKIADALQPHCEKFTFAGSLRRRCAEVGDIEAVVLPKLTEAPDGLFGTKMIRSQGFVLGMPGTVIAGDPVDGRYVKMNVGGKLLNPEAKSREFRFDGGIQFDLFIPQPSDYGRILAIRTGPSNYSARVLAVKWTEMGWCGVQGLGLRKQSQCVDMGKDGKHDWRLKPGLTYVTMPPEFPEEVDFFKFLGMEWVEPRYRV